MKQRKYIIIGILLFCSLVYGQDTGKKKMTMRESLLLPNWRSYVWSPDGNKIAFTKTERDSGDYESTTHIWLYDVGKEEQMQLTNSHKGESSPQWMPGGRIVFSSERDGKNKMYVISITGGEAKPMFKDEEAPTGGVFSNDYTKLVYTKQSKRHDKEEWEKKKKKKDDGYFWETKLTFRHIRVYDIESEKSKQLTEGNFDNTNPQWSPDGKWIVFMSNRSGILFKGDNNTDIWIVPSDSGMVRQLTTNKGPDRSPSFSPMVKELHILPVIEKGMALTIWSSW